MRYKSRFRREEMGNVGKNLVTFLIIAAFAALVLGVSTVGDFLAKEVFVPLLGTPAPSATVSAPAGTARQVQSVALPELNLYLVQSGAYENTAAAQTAAQNVQKRGGAGYIMKGTYNRVFMSGYLSKTDAESVIEKLKAQGSAGELFTFNSGSASVRLTATDTQISALSEALAFYPQMCKTLCKAIISYDKGEITAAAYRNLASEQAAKTDEHVTRISGVISNTDNAVIESLLSLMRSARVELNDISLQTSLDDAAFSACIKHNFLLLSERYSVFIQNVK